MALDPTHVRILSEQCQKIAEKHLCKLGVRVVPKDRQARRRRPDYVLHDLSTDEPVAVVEVKLIVSAGYDQEDGVHLSTLDESAEGKVRMMPSVAAGYRQALEEATEQYRQLAADEPQHAGLPLLVVFFYDFFADPSLLDRRQPDFPDLSGYLLLVENRELLAVAADMPMDELERRIDSGTAKEMPPPAKEWRLLENQHARVPVPEHIRLACLLGYPEDPEGWDGVGAVPAKIVRRPAGPTP